MIKALDKVARLLFPNQHETIKARYNQVKKKTHPKLDKDEFVHLLRNEMQVQEGEVVFVHASMRSLYPAFSKKEILGILLDSVGEEGTLLFPCWQFSVRAEEYINSNDIIFDVRTSSSAMGKLSDVVRLRPDAYRSFHPTNSIVAVGKHAKELTDGHDKALYPCGELSPLYKMIRYNARIIGLGVTVNNLTFVHTIEDVMQDRFPLQTRMPDPMECRTIDGDGNEHIIPTMVASTAISNRDVSGFFKKSIPADTCNSFRSKRMNFFSLKSVELYEQLETLALDNQTIYLSVPESPCD